MFSLMDKSGHRLSLYFVVKHIFQLTTRWAGQKESCELCLRFAGSRKASRKSHHEFNEKRQISRVRRVGQARSPCLAGWWFGWLVDCQARPRDHNCLQKVYARSDSVHQKMVQ